METLDVHAMRLGSIFLFSLLAPLPLMLAPGLQTEKGRCYGQAISHE